MKIFAKIRFFWGAIVIAFVVGALMIPSIVFFNKHKGIIMHKLNRVILFFLGGKLEQEGEIDTTADMYIMNHQGIIDIIAMEALQTNHLRWVAKKELFKIPWFGNLLKFGDMISLDRENKAGLVKLLKDVKESRDTKDRAVVIFPEGTRAKGQALLPFKQGTNMVAKKLGLKVQPVVITGSKHLINEHDKTGHNSTIRFHFLPMINVKEAEDEWFIAVQKEMQKVIDHEYAYNYRSR